MEARFVARVEFQPRGVGACRIVRKHRFEAFGGGPRELDEFIADGAMAAEYALLHAEFLHLLQDHGGGADVGPQHDGIDARIFDDLKLAAEVGIAGHELLLDHHGMAESARCVAEFQNSEAAIAVVHAQNRDSLQSEFGVDVARQRVALQAIVLNDR